MHYRPTQLDLAESGRRRAARAAHALAFMIDSPQRPTRAELARLREKRPAVWNRFPESRCIDAEGD